MDNYKSNIASRVRHARLMCGMTQTQAARKIKKSSGEHITTQQLYKLEYGISNISSDKIQQMAIIYGVSITFFFPDSDEDMTKGVISDVSKMNENQLKFLAVVSQAILKFWR
jgi:transcriptional regulator with XRE-family HTH domain